MNSLSISTPLPHYDEEYTKALQDYQPKEKKTMKKITLTLLALLSLTLTGCGYNEVDTNNCLNNADDALMKAEYEGHSYIIYKGSQKGGIIHDPDCPCREKGGSEHGED